MELHTEVRPTHVSDTLVAAVVGVDEEFLPAIGQCLGVYGVTVVLRCDVALAGKQAGAGDVGTAVTELHLDCVGTSSSCEQLVTKTDTEDGCARFVHGSLDVLDGRLHHGWVTGTVGDEKTVVVLASKLREVVVPWNLQDFDSSPHQAPELVVFETDVNGDDTYGATGGMLEGSGRVGLVELGFLDGDYACVRADLYTNSYIVYLQRPSSSCWGRAIRFARSCSSSPPHRQREFGCSPRRW